MRQTKTISLSESQKAWLKEFSEKHHFKESEVVQMLISKASIDNILQQILVDKITAKKEGIKKTEVTSHNVQIVKEKDASNPIVRDISATDRLKHLNKINNIYHLYQEGKAGKGDLEIAWLEWLAVDEIMADRWARERGLLG